MKTNKQNQTDENSIRKYKSERCKYDAHWSGHDGEGKEYNEYEIAR